jgi:hypothetical protein
MIIGLIGYVTMFRSSPGPLSSPHAAVAGSSFIKDCKKCHAQKDVSVGCLSCHTEIQSQLANKQGYHHFLMKEKKIGCGQCHSEHNGSDFKLVNKVSWENKDPKEFKHPHTAFRLTGKHDSLGCDACHHAKNTKPFELAAFAGHPRAETFFGLTQACKDCHEDVHAGGLTPSCEKCHGQASFKPAQNFNHDTFFPLRGGHARVACNKCHETDKRNAEKKSDTFPFDRVKGTRCLDCHGNPHRTTWKESCESCHRASDAHWSSADARMTKVAHSLTGFHLMAPHERASCSECHKTGLNFADKYPNPKAKGYNRFEKNCESCHQDPHRGQFTERHSHCFDCHYQQKFSPSKFSVKDHTAYPLVGAHALAACNKCHVKDKKTGVRQFSSTPQACDQCHRDIHRGQFRVNNKTICESCHKSAKSWKSVSFDHNTQSRFKLDEAHAKVTCKECHPVVHLSNGESVVQFKPLRSKCSDCHDFAQ